MPGPNHLFPSSLSSQELTGPARLSLHLFPAFWRMMTVLGHRISALGPPETSAVAPRLKLKPPAREAKGEKQ